MKKIRRLALLSILIGLMGLLGACTLLPTPMGASTTPAVFRIPLGHSPTGTASLRWSSMSHTLMVTIMVSGLAPGSTHPMHIHAGTCSAMKQIVYLLRPLIADTHGVGVSTSIIAGVISEIPARGWAVNIHNGPTLTTGLEARPIACGNITRVRNVTRGVQSVHAILTTTTSPDENVHGMAQIRMLGQTIIVTLSLSGMAPNTTHLAHIHVGTCAAQGPVLFPLQPLVADAQGNAMTITTIMIHTLPPTHWFINVHEAGTMAAMMAPQGFNPIACGNSPSLKR